MLASTWISIVALMVEGEHAVLISANGTSATSQDRGWTSAFGGRAVVQRTSLQRPSLTARDIDRTSARVRGGQLGQFRFTGRLAKIRCRTCRAADNSHFVRARRRREISLNEAANEAATLCPRPWAEFVAAAGLWLASARARSCLPAAAKPVPCG